MTGVRCGQRGGGRQWPDLPSVRSAFTLLEIVMVLAITMLMLGMATPAITGMLRAEQLKAPARELEAMAVTARSSALAEQQPYQILINRTGFQLVGPGNKGVLASYKLPEGVIFEMADWPAEKWSAPKSRVWYFSPSGLCEPIRVMFRKGDSYFSQKYSAVTGWDQEESFFIR